MWIACATLLVGLGLPFSGGGPAQEATAEQERPQERKGFGIWTIETSRRLFAACDIDADDRIRYFEARKTLLSAQRREGFRAFDTDKNGYIEFDEFDARFRKLTETGQRLFLTGEALLRLAKGLETPAPQDPVVQRMFRGLDLDGDETISRTEWQALGPMLQQLLGMNADTAFRTLDKDRSGHIEIAELATLKEQFALLENVVRRGQPGKQLRPLPEAFQAADRNGNSLLEPAELRYAMERIHPAMARHAALILKRADQNRDGVLDALELRDTGAPGIPTRNGR